MRHSKRPHYSPVNYRPSPRSGLVHLFTSHLSPLSAQRPPLSAQRLASGYQNRVHKNHEYLITCPHGPIPRDFLSDRLSTWGNAARSSRSHAIPSRMRSPGSRGDTPRLGSLHLLIPRSLDPWIPSMSRPLNPPRHAPALLVTAMLVIPARPARIARSLARVRALGRSVRYSPSSNGSAALGRDRKQRGNVRFDKRHQVVRAWVTPRRRVGVDPGELAAIGAGPLLTTTGDVPMSRGGFARTRGQNSRRLWPESRRLCRNQRWP